MKTLGTISLAVLFLLMTGSVATYSQDDSRPSQAQEEKDKARNNDKQREDKTVKQEDKDASKPEKQEQEPAARQEEHPDNNAAKQEQKQEKQEQKEQRSGQKSDQRMERDQHQHPAAANQGRHIPDDKFRAHFGRQHTFHVHRTEIINVSQPVVVFSGYSFELVDAWPSDWGFDDDCYIDYEDGEYFLFDTFHPGIRIAVFIVD